MARCYTQNWELEASQSTRRYEHEFKMCSLIQINLILKKRIIIQIVKLLIWRKILLYARCGDLQTQDLKVGHSEGW